MDGAQEAAEREGGSGRGMGDLQGASGAETPGEVVRGDLGEVGAEHLLLVAGVAEGGGAPAAPCGDAAAELALEQQKVGGVDGARTRRAVLTSGAQQHGRPVVDVVGVGIGAALGAPCEEGLLTAHAHVEGVEPQHKVRRVTAVGGLDGLVLQREQAQVQHLLLDDGDAAQLVRELFVGDARVAQRAAGKVERDAARRPTGGQLLPHALQMEHVPASQLHARCRRQRVHVADRAQVRVCLRGPATPVQTRQARALVSGAVAAVAAGEHALARLGSGNETRGRPALRVPLAAIAVAVAAGKLLRSDGLPTETAGGSQEGELVVFAGEALVVRVLGAAGTEGGGAAATADAEAVIMGGAGGGGALDALDEDAAGGTPQHGGILLIVSLHGGLQVPLQL